MRKSLKILLIIFSSLFAENTSAAIGAVAANNAAVTARKNNELEQQLDAVKFLHAAAQAELADAKAANAREQAELADAKAANAAAQAALAAAEAANAVEQRDKVALQDIISNLQGKLRAAIADTASSEQIQALNAELADALARLQALQDASGGGSTGGSSGGGSTGVSETKAEIDVRKTREVLNPLVVSIGERPADGTAVASAQIVADAYRALQATIADLIAAQGASGTPSGGAGGSGGGAGGSSGNPPSGAQAPSSATNVVTDGGNPGSAAPSIDTGGSVPPASGPASNPSSGGTSGGQTGSTGGPEMTPGGSGTPTGGPGVAVPGPMPGSHGTCPTPNANDLTLAELVGAIMGKITSGDTGFITGVAQLLGLRPSESSTTDAGMLPLGQALIVAAASVAEGALPHGGPQ